MYTNDTDISLPSDKIEEINTVVNAELVYLEKGLKSNKLSLNIVNTQPLITGQKIRANEQTVR